MNVKICGIATAREAESAVSEGADLLGFVFMRGPRRADPRLVREIVRTLPEHVSAVGVFRNPSLEEARSVAAESGIAAAQLNGNEPPEFAAALGVRVIKTFATFTRQSLERRCKQPSRAIVPTIGQ